VVEIRDEDDESALHERIKEVERRLLVDVVGGSPATAIALRDER